MKNLHYIAAIVILMFSTAVIAHHPADGIVDDDVYTMIDELVADTPHADLTFDDMDDDDDMDDVTASITTQTIVPLEKMLDDGLLTYIGMLDGDVSVTIIFNSDGTVTMTVVQIP